jgi:hypothetical protein
MIVNTFYYSNSDTCGISIFNGHLRRALSRIGVNVLDTNLRTAERIVRTPIGILHYVPGSYSSRKASNALIELLAALHDSQRLFVILHGLHSYGESRFPQAIHTHSVKNTSVLCFNARKRSLPFQGR